MRACHLSALLAASAALTCAHAETFDSLTASGAVSTGVDVTQLVRSSIDGRLTQARVNDRTDGGSLWLDAAGVKSRSDRLTGASGYKATAGVANLGADVKKGSHLFGVVYSYGKADFDTVKTEHRDGDASYYGVKIYGEEQWGEAALRASLGWLRMKSGVDSDGGRHVYGMDGNLWTLDLSANYRIRTAWMDLLPHAGAQATLITADDWSDGVATGEPDNALLWQFPVGVTLTTARAVGAYSVRPTLDVTYAAAAGDRKMTSRLNGRQVKTLYAEDGVFRASAGLAVTGEKGTMGVLYRYETAERGRDTHQVTLSGHYVF